MEKDVIINDNSEKSVISNDFLDIMPLLPLRDVVVYPRMVLPLFIGRDKSIQALESAAQDNKKIILATQKESTTDEPLEDDIYRVGTISVILQLLKLPDGTVKMLVEGLERGKITEYIHKDPFFAVKAEVIETEGVDEEELAGLLRSILSQFEQYVKLNRRIPPEIINSLFNVKEPIRLIDTIVAHMSLKVADKQEILEIQNLKNRITYLMKLIETEIDLLQVEKRIRGDVKNQMEKNHREYYLNEQMKAIQKELGHIGEDGVDEIERLKKSVTKSGMPHDAQEKTLSEINKMKMMSPMSAEATVSRNYVDWMLSVPWKKRSKLSQKLSDAENVLNENHYGLEKLILVLCLAKFCKNLQNQK